MGVGTWDGLGAGGRGGGGVVCPPVATGGDEQLPMEQSPPCLGRDGSGWQLPGCLVGVGVCVWLCVHVCECVDGDPGGGDAAGLGLSLTRGPSGDSSPPPPRVCCSRLQARRRQED